MTDKENNNHPFRANAHLLKLLGDELIGDDRLAVFELIKNGYDADATQVHVTLDIDCDEPKIIVSDNGCGMDSDTIVAKWLEIGTPSKRGENRTLTPEFKRAMLGEKGVGRLAVHKLGSKLKMTTRMQGQKECFLEIDWSKLISDSASINDAKVQIFETSSAQYFEDNKSGTKMEISCLHNSNWTRGAVRSLRRMTTTLISPFETDDTFNVELEVPGYDQWLSDLFELDDILSHSIWQFSFSINENAEFIWNYKFTPPKHLKTLKSIEKNKSGKLELIDRKGDALFLQPQELDSIGPILGEFYIYDRRPEILKKLPQTDQLKTYLNEQTGVRVYRDNIRVYNYGEKGDDWLGLDAARVNAPAQKMGTNNVIAAISLDLEKSNGLKEKTNREGFDHNDFYQKLLNVGRSVVAEIDKQRRDDRKALDEALKVQKPSKELGYDFKTTFSELKSKLSKHKKAEEEVLPYLDKLDREYHKVQDVMLRSGLTGLNLALVFHEIERELNTLDKAINCNESIDNLKSRSTHLLALMDGFAPLLKKNPAKKANMSKLLERAKINNEGRFKFHKVVFSCPMITGEEEDFEILEPANLILGVLHNLIDNSIYWSRRRVQEENISDRKAGILVSNVSEQMGAPAISIIDNGPGFTLSPEEAVTPFESDKSDGSGVGLYFANLMMETIGGKLLITSAKDIDSPPAYDGAAVVLIFKEKK